MNFFTNIAISHPPRRFSYADAYLLMGSCFAQNIGETMEANQFDIDVNPFGILYNPASIASALRQIVVGKPYGEADLFLWNGLWHSWMHHGGFSSASKGTCLANINARLVRASARMDRLTCLVVTWGTAYAYRLRQTGQVVSNCHKVPEREFVRERLSVASIVEDWTLLLDNLFSRNPQLSLILTVSPIRHWKDGAHGNQLSKATLLLAIDQLQERYPERIIYFPAYELMMDELRDYRFYAGDMLHPSEQAVSYIWEMFCENYLASETLEAMQEWQKIQKALSHRPLNPESEAYKQFQHQTMLKKQRFMEKFPYFGAQTDKGEL